MKHLKTIAFNLGFSFLLAAAGTAHLFAQESEGVNADTQSQDSGRVMRTSFDRIATEQLKEYLIATFGLDRDRAHNFSRWIREASLKFSVPESLLTSVIMAESSFRYHAVSHYGAVGPTQVVPRYWSSQCEGDIVNDPEANVHCGALALSHYYEKRCNRNPICAVAMYNVGPTAYFSKSKEDAEAMDRYLTKINRGLMLMDNMQVAQVGMHW